MKKKSEPIYEKGVSSEMREARRQKDEMQRNAFAGVIRDEKGALRGMEGEDPLGDAVPIEDSVMNPPKEEEEEE